MIKPKPTTTVKRSMAQVLADWFRVVFRKAVLSLFLGLILTGVFLYTRVGGPARVEAAIPTTLNFQARLMNSGGAIVPDGYYNIQFKLYDASSGGSNVWTESWYDSNGVTAGNDNRVQVKAGYVSVYLGDQNPLTGIDWTQQYWLTMNIGGTTQTASPTYDGEMNPRLRLTSVPYAQAASRADNLDGIDSTGFAQLAPSSIQGVSSANTLLRLNQTGAGNLLQLQTGGVDQLTLSNSGALTVAGAGTFGGTLTLSNVSTDITTGTNEDLTVVANGTGTINLNDTVSVAGNATFNGAQVTNNGATLNTAHAVSDVASGGNIGTAASTVDAYTTFNINQTTAGQTLTLPNPTSTTSGRMAYVNNVGTTSFTMYGNPLSPGQSNAFIWNGSAWVITITLSTSNSVTSVGTIDSQTKSANGAVIASGAIFLQTANATNPGLVSTGSQTFAGAKTFSGAVTVAGLLTGQAGATVSGAAISLNDSSNFATNINTGTSTGAVNIGNSAAGAIALQSASTISLTGATTVTGLTSGVALTVNNSTSTGNILNLQDNGTNVLTVADGGAVVLQNTTDSTAALDVKRSSGAGGASVLTVDATNSQTILRGTNSSATFTLGSELITSQDFTNATYWTSCNGGAGGWSGTSTTATHNTGNTVACSSTFNPTTGNLYQVTFTISGYTGGFGYGNMTMGGASQSGFLVGNGTYTYSFFASTTAGLSIAPVTSFDGTFSNISIKQITGTTGTNAALKVLNSSGSTSLEVRAPTNGTFIGTNAGYNYVSGNGNTAIGTNALYSNYTGSNNTAIGTNAGYTDGSITTPYNLTNATAIGYDAQVQTSNSLVLGGTGGASVNVGIGIPAPINTLSVSGFMASGGTISQSASTTVVGSGTSFASYMVGNIIVYADGTTDTIASVTDSTHLTVSTSRTHGSSNYAIYYAGLQAGGDGTVKIGTAIPDAIPMRQLEVKVQNSQYFHDKTGLYVSRDNDASYTSAYNLVDFVNGDTDATGAVLGVTQSSTGAANAISVTTSSTTAGVTVATPAGGTAYAATGVTNGTAYNANTVTSGTGISITGLTSGNGVNVGGSIQGGSALRVVANNNSWTSGMALDVTGNASNVSSNFTGSYIRVNPTRTLTSAATRTDTGNFLNLTRSNTTNGASSILNTTGDLATLSSNCTQTQGTCTDTSSILKLQQSYAAASGVVLNVLGAGTGNLATLDATNTSANGVLVDVQSSSSSQYALKVTTNNGATTAFQVNGDGSATLGVSGTTTTLAGNVSQSGAGTLSTGTGAVSLNGNTSVTGGKYLATAAGTDYTATGPQDSISIPGSLVRVTSASTVTIQGIAGGADGRILTIVNASSNNIVLANQSSGTAANSIITGTGANMTLAPDAAVTLIYDSTTARWRVRDFGGNSVNTVGTIDSQTKSANGAVISGNTLYLQNADASNVGLVSTGTQTFAGAKTFNSTATVAGLLTGQAGATISGGNLSYNGGNSYGVTLTSDLTGGARSTSALTVTQANDATNNSTAALATFTNSDTGSTAVPVVSIAQAAGATAASALDISLGSSSGRGITVTGQVGGSGNLLNLTQTSSAGAVIYLPGGVATGQGLFMVTTNNSTSTGKYIDISGTSNNVGTNFSGNYINVSPIRQVTTASATRTDSGNYLNVARSNEVNAAGATYNVTGDVANLSSTCVQTLGTCTDTGNVLELNQSYASASGSVLNILNSGTGAGITVSSATDITTGTNEDLTVVANGTGVINLNDSVFVGGATGTAGTVEKLRVNTPTTVDNAANAVIATSATTSKGLVIQGAASQSANLQEWQDSTGGVLSSITSGGKIRVASGTSAIPNYSFQQDQDTGLYSTGNNDWIGVSAAGSEVARFGTQGLLVASTGTVGTVEKFRVNTPTTVDNTASAIISTGGTANRGLVIQGVAGQTANLLHFSSSAGTTLAKFNSNGDLYINNIGDLAATGSVITTNPTGTDNGAIVVSTRSAANKALIARGSASQTANLQEWQDSSSAVLASVTAAGVLQINSTGTAGAVEKFRVNTPTTVDNTAAAILSTGATTSKGLVVQGVASQTADLLQLQNSSGSVMSTFTANGALKISSSSSLGTNQQLAVNQITTTDNNAVAIIATGGDANKGLVIQAKNGTQTANLQEWQSSAGTILASVSSNGSIATTGNFSQTGTGTFGTGTGAVSLNGATTINGSQLTNNGSTLNSSSAISNLASGGVIGTAAATVDVKTTFDVNQTTASQTLTLPAPTTATSGRIVYVNNVGSASFTMYGSVIAAGKSNAFMWNGTAWVTSVSLSGSVVSTIGTLDAQTKSADGAVISSNALYLQTADATYAGLMSTGTQAFAGDKTFNGTVGLGATASTARLTVKDAGYRAGINLRAASSSTDRLLTYIGDGTNSTVSDEVYFDAVNTNIHFRTGPSGTIEALNIDKSSSTPHVTVGSNTSSPGSTFNVNGGTSIGSGYITTAAPTDGAIIQGNVGLGISSGITSRLAVKDGGYRAGITLQAASSGTNRAFTYIGDGTNGTTADDYYQDVANGAIHFRTGASGTSDALTVLQNGGVTVAGLLTANSGATVLGATTSINASSNFATNINTGTSTGAVTIGNSAAGAIALQSASTISLTGTTTITGLSGGSSKALVVNNSTSTGNILEAQDNGSAVFTVADGGAVSASGTLDVAGHSAFGANAGVNYLNGVLGVSTPYYGYVEGANNEAINAVNVIEETFTDISAASNNIPVGQAISLVADPVATAADNFLVGQSIYVTNNAANSHGIILLQGNTSSAVAQGAGNVAFVTGTSSSAVVNQGTGGTVGYATGSMNTVMLQGDGDVDNVYGVASWIQANGFTGTVANVSAISAGIHATGATITDATGLYVDTAQGTITNNYGIHIAAQDAGTNDYGLAVGVADTQTLWVNDTSDSTTANGGIAFGQSRDTNLYRSAADTLKTDDSLQVAQTLDVQGHSAFGPTATVDDTTLINTGETYSSVLTVEEAFNNDFNSINNRTGITNHVVVNPTSDVTDFSTTKTYGIDTRIKTAGTHNAGSVIGNSVDLNHNGSGLAILAGNTVNIDIGASATAYYAMGNYTTINCAGICGYGTYGSSIGLTNAVGSTTAATTLLAGLATNNGTISGNALTGADLGVDNSATGTADAIKGLNVTASNSGTTGDITGGSLYATNAGAADNLYGAYISAVDSGTLTGSSYGLAVDLTNIDYGIKVSTAGTQTLWLGSDANGTTANAGIAFGSSRDTNLYRSAADTLKTDDSLVVGTDLTAQGNFVQSGSGTFSTGTGAVSLNGATTINGSATISGSNTFTSGTGTVLLQGNTDIASTVSLATKVGTTFTTAGTSNNAALNVASYYLLDTSGAAQVINGITAGRDGQRLTLTNIDASSTVTFTNNSGSATGSKVITGTGVDIVLPVGGTISLIYDSTNSIWRVEALGAVAGGFANQQLSNLSGTVAVNASLTPAGDNALDLGSASNSWRTLYADTSVLTPTVDTASAGTLNIGASNASAVKIATNGVSRAYFDTSNNLYVGNAGSGGTAAAPNSFTIRATGSSTAGTTGADISLYGGAGATTTTGSTGGGVVIAGGNAGGSGNNNGGSIVINGGAKANAGQDGSVLIGTSNTNSINMGASGVYTYNSGSLQVSQSFTALAGGAIGGGNIGINNSSNYTTDINTGTSTGAVTIGNTSNANNTVTIQGGSSGGINIGTAASSVPITIGNSTGGALRVGQNGGTLQLDGTNFDVSTAGVVTLAGGQTQDITTAGAATATALVIQPGTSTGASSNGPATTIKGGDGSGTTTVVGGALTLQAGSATGGSGSRTGGNVIIQGGTGATANGAVNIGTANTASVGIGASGVTTTNNGALTVSQTLTASNGLTVTTGVVNLTGTSGALALSGLGASSISTGSNALTITSSNFNTTATGINSTAIGATTASTGAFTSLAASGNFLQSGTGTFGTGTGAVSLNGSTTVGASAGSGTLLTNNGATFNATLVVANDSDGGALGGTPGTPLTAAQSVDIYTGFSIGQTTTGQTITLPTPTASTAYGRIIYVSNIGTASFTLGSSLVLPGNTATLVWSNTNGAASWQYAGDGGGSGNYIQNQNTVSQTANFLISGSGTASTSFLTPAIDTASAGTLSVGNSTATAVSICNSAACNTINIGTNADADAITIGDINDTTAIKGGTVGITGTTTITGATTIDYNGATQLTLNRAAGGNVTMAYTQAGGSARYVGINANGYFGFDTDGNLADAPIQINPAGYLLFGSSSDTNLYRTAASTLKTDGALVISPTVASTVALTVNGTTGTAATALAVAQTGTATAMTVSQSQNNDGLVITTTNATQTTASALKVTQSGTSTGYTGNLVDITGSSTTGTGNTLNVLGVNTTAGNTVNITNNAITTGNGLNVNHTTSAITTGSLVTVNSTAADAFTTGSLVNVSSTGNFTSTANTAGLLNVSSTASAAGTNVNIANSFATQTTSTLLNVVQSGVTTGYTGNVANFVGTGTTGASNVVNIANNAINGTGTALNVNSSTTGALTNGLARFNGSAAHTGTVVAVLSASTAGTGVSITDSAAGQTTTRLLDIASSGYTTGYTGNIVNITGTGTTGAGNVVHIANNAINGTGTALTVDSSTTGALTTGLAYFNASAAHTGNVVAIQSASTAGTGLSIADSAAGQTATTLLNVASSGYTTGYTGNVATFTGTSTTGTSNVVNIANNAINGNGTALNVNSSTTGALTTGLAYFNASAAHTGNVVAIQSASTAGTGLNITDSAASQTSTTLLNIASSGYTTGYTGNIVNITGTGTTGAGNVLHVANNAINGNGTALLVDSSTTGALTNGVARFNASGAHTGSVVTIQSASTAGTGLSIADSAASQTSTRLLDIASSGYTTGYTGNIANFSGTGTTGAGNVVNIANNAINGTGTALNVNSSTTGALTTGLAYFNASAAHTGNVVAIQSASTAGTGLSIADSAAGQTTTTLLNIASSGYTTGYTGNVVSISGTSTTGAANVLSVSSANTTAGNAVNIAANGLTTGTGLNVNSTGTMTTTGALAAFTANSATTSTGVVTISATGLTSGGNALNVIANATAGVNAIKATGNFLFAQGADRTLAVETQSTSNTAGNALTVNAATGNGSGNGGLLTLQGGAAGATGTGGGVTIASGIGGGTSGASGAVSIASGTSTSGATGTVGLGSGNATAGTSGALTINTGTGTTGTGAISLTTGNASAGTAGNISIDNGTSSSGTPTISIGTGAYAHTVSIATGNAANAVTVGSTNSAATTKLQGGAGNLNVTNTGIGINTGATAPTADLSFGNGSNRTINVLANASNAAGYNLTMSAGAAGAGATGFAGGTLTLQGGGAAGTSGAANGGDVTITGGTAINSGYQGLVNLSTTAFSTAPIQTISTTGVQAITAGNQNIYSTLPITASVTGVIATLGDPGQSVIGRILYVAARSGSQDFTLRLNSSRTAIDITLKANSTATLIWNGTDWTAAGASSSTDLQAAYNNTVSSAGGAELVLNASGGAADGLTIRNNATTPITGGLLEVQTSTGSNLFSVNNNATEYASNGGAETSGSSTCTTNQFPANTWSPAPAGGTCARDTTSGEFVTGQASASVTTTATQYHGIANKLSTTLTAGLRYTASFTVKGSANFTSLEAVYSSDGTATAGNVRSCFFGTATLTGTSGSQTTTTITGSNFTASMVGSVVVFANGQSALITGYTNSTTLTTSAAYSQTVTSQNYSIYTNTITTNQSTWTRVSCDFIAPSGATSSNSVFIRQNDATARSFFVDNLSVTVNASVNHAADGSVDSALSASSWVAVGGSVTRDTSNIYDTSGAVSVAVSTTANRGVYNNLSGGGIVPTASSSGIQYRASFYVKANTGTVTLNNSTPSVYYSPDGGTTKKACYDLNTTSIATTAGYTLVSCIFTTDNTTVTNARFYVVNTATTDFYVDALTITLNTNTANNVQIGGANKGGPVTLFTLDRSAGAPIAANNDAYLGSMYFDTSTNSIQCYGTSGWGACGAAPDNIVNLNPEYAGAVLNGSGVGTMTADFCANQSSVLSVNTSICTTTGDARNYYKWTSPQATQQTYSIYVTYQLPSTFKSFASDNTVQLTGRVDNTSNAAVTYEMFKNQSSVITACGTETTVTTSANTWQTVGINGNEATGTGGCSFGTSAAGAFVIFKINMKANSNATAYASTLSFTTKGQ